MKNYPGDITPGQIQIILEKMVEEMRTNNGRAPKTTFTSGGDP